MPQELTPDEQRGVNAMIELQAMVGVEEPPARALRNWRAFSRIEKNQTLKVYELLCKPNNTNE